MTVGKVLASAPLRQRPEPGTGHVRYRRRMEPTDETGARADEDALLALELARRARRWKAKGGLGDMIGGAIVGFDYQVFRATKQPAILVESAKPVRGLSGEGGAMLSIEYPADGDRDGDGERDGDETSEPLTGDATTD